jgi:hypothetical protein
MQGRSKPLRKSIRLASPGLRLLSGSRLGREPRSASRMINNRFCSHAPDTFKRLWIPRVICLFGISLVALQCGCACTRSTGKNFHFSQDGLAYANELKWEYEFRESGEVVTRKADPPPDYSLRCFPMVRAAREFFYHARFAPDLSRRTEKEYRPLVQWVIGRNSRCPAKETEQIVIPGFANLHEFSSVHGDLLKHECGGVWRSFFQRGNWRMILPLTRSGREATATRFVREIQSGRLPIAHVYRFPNTTLNHALLLYSAEENGDSISFRAYDPNDPERPAHLSFARRTHTFLFERNRYFAGGAVRVYEVYRGIAF